MNAYYVYLRENFFQEADFLKFFDKNRMTYKLRYYANISKSFMSYFGIGFLKRLNISFVEEFFLSFSQHVEQIFEDIFQIYKKYFHEIDCMDFENFYNEFQTKKIPTNPANFEENHSILPKKIQANFKKTDKITSSSIKMRSPDKNDRNKEEIIKKTLLNSYYKYEFDESSIENNSNENKEPYKIRINIAESINTTNVYPKWKNSENFFETDKNTSNEVQNKTVDFNHKNNNYSNQNIKNSSFYSYPQSKTEINKKNTAKNHKLSHMNNSHNEDFVMKNVQKMQKLYSKEANSQRPYHITPGQLSISYQNSDEIPNENFVFVNLFIFLLLFS